MRYEDASQMGSGQVDARNDADHLAARDYGPATGNVISGTGTITGSAGLDIAGAGAGRVTAIDGAGGSDSSFSAGKLSVDGQYGTLTMDARGNYSYERDPGTPSGVSDIFHYTLSTKDGATDNARLVINIGDLPKLATDATRVVPGADGVVTLPPGVELSDIRVVGRDLVVTLPDGSTMIIVDGAIFVPQLVLGGVEVPASNLAALLIGSEPRPAAGDLTGNQQSSGGNFEVPVAPLDPGVPLGDLLPPTELYYTPPEVEELFDILEDNDPPFIGASSVNVSEEGVVSVSAPIPDSAGSPDTTNSPTNGGVIPVSDPDGDPVSVILGTPSDSLTSAGVAITWSVSPDGHTLTGSAGANTVITLVINDAGSYTVTLLRPVDHPTAGGEQGTSFVVPVSVSDGEDITTGGTITVTIEDDSPTIEGRVAEPILIVDDTTFNINDTDAVSGAFAVSYGADGPAASNPISYAMGLNAGATGLFDTATGAQVVLTLESGVVVGRAGAGGAIVFTVSVDGSGNVTLDQQRAVVHDDPADPVETGGSAATLAADNLVTVSIVATDRDGDQASLTVNIGQNLHFEDDGPTALQAQLTGTVDEDGIVEDVGDDGDGVAGGPPGAGSFADVPGEIVSATGNVGALFASGNDLPLTYSLINNFAGLEAQGLTSQGVPLSYSVSFAAGVHTLTASAPGGNIIFTFTLNSTTGAYNFTLLDQLDHPTLDDLPGDNLENDLAIQLGSIIQATDGDGDSVTALAGEGGGLVIIVDDDTPVALNDSNTLSVELDALAVTSIVAAWTDVVLNEGTANQTDNDADGAIDEIRWGVPDESDQSGYAFVDNPDLASQDVLTNQQFIIGTFTHFNEPVFDQELLSTILVVNFTAVIGGESVNVGPIAIEFQHDETPNTGTDLENRDIITITPQTATVVINGVSYELEILGLIDEMGNVVTEVRTFEGQANSYDLAVRFVSLEAFSVTGNVITNDESGADEPIGVVAASGFDGSADSVADGLGNFHVNGQYGTLTINADGSYTYELTTDPDLIPDGAFETFTYSIEDADGDGTTAELVINLEIDRAPELDAPDQGEAGTLVSEVGLPPRGGEPAGTGEASDGNSNNNSNTSETTAGVITFTAPDGPAVVRIDGVVVTGAIGQVFAGTHGNLTITSYDAGTGQIGYSYTLADNTSGNATFDDFAISVTDADGDVANDTLVVNIVDDAPLAVNDTDAVAAGSNGPATGNVLTGVEVAVVDDGNASDGVADNPGADGGRVSFIDNSQNGAAGVAVPDGGSVMIAGQYGTLTIFSNGDYSYARTPGQGGGQNEVFTYTLLDGDSDTTTATLTISIADSPVTLDAPDQGEAGTLVSEVGLPPRGGEPAGTGEASDGNSNNNSNTSETTAGVITFTAPDGPAVVRIDGVVVTGAIGQVFAGTHGNLTITSYDAGTGQIGYSYTLADNTSGNATFDDFAISVTDADGDVANDTLVVNIVDDAPIAVNDTDVVPGGQTTATGNVITDAAAGDAGDGDNGKDNVGADNATIAGLASNNVPANVDNNAAGGFVVTGQYGTLTMQADGSYSYARSDGAPGNVTDVFTYTLLDGDGDSTTATLTIDIQDAAPNLPDPAAVLLDDDALANGNPGGTGDDVNSSGTPGQLVGTGGDGDLDYFFTGLNTLPAGFTVNPVNAGQLQVLQGATVVLTINLNNEDGSYSVVQNNPIVHPAGSNENNVIFSIGVNVTDIDNDTENATITINVDDDTPTAANDTDTIASGSVGPATGNVITDAAAGDAGDGDTGADSVGADGGAAIVGLASNNVPANVDNNPAGGFVVAGAFGTLTMQADGSYSYARNAGQGAGQNEVFTYTLTDADGDTTTATLTIAIADAAPNLPDPAAVLLDDDALANGNPGGTGDDVNSSGTPGQLVGTGGDGDLDYFFTGLNTLPAGFTVNPVNAGQLQVLQGATVVLTINLNNEDGSYSVVQNNPIVHPAGSNENNVIFSIGVNVTDIDNDTENATITINVDDDTPTAANDTDTIASGSVGPATGNVITDAAAGDAGDGDTGADSVGADGGAAIVGLASNNVPANVDNNPAGGFVVAGAFGTLTMQADGSYSYARNAGQGAGQNEVFTYTLTDADGDTTTATLTIAIGDAAPNLPDPAAVLLDDDALANGNPGGTGDDVNSSGTPGQLVGTGGDGDLDYFFTGLNTLPAGFTVNPVNAGQLQVLQGATVVLTINLNNEDGSYTVVQNNPIVHPAGSNENNVIFSIGVNVTDIDNDTENATITINVDDDTPIATNVQLTGTVDEDGVLEGAADAGQGDGVTGGANGVPGATGDVTLPNPETVATGSVATLFQSGADVPLTYSLLTNTSGLPALTSQGVAVTYLVVGNTLTASAPGGNTVFTFVLNANGTYTFTLVDQLDHPTLNGLAGDDTENDLSINLSSLIQATDADGDSVSAGANGLIITVDDDVPVAVNDTPTLVVEIDDLEVNDIVAEWVSWDLDPGDPNPTQLDQDGDGATDEIRWGTPATANGQSRYGFVDNPDLATDTVLTNTLFSLGTFTHYNQPINGAELDFVTLEVTFTAIINGVPINVGPIQIFFDHDETPNTGNAEQNRDIITINQTTTVINIGGVEYELQVEGLVNEMGQVVTEVRTFEGQANSYELLVRFVPTDSITLEGNVLLNDMTGADETIEVVAANGDTTPDGDGNFEVVGLYGTLTINENGDYSYRLTTDREDVPEGAVEHFTYTIEDFDGDRQVAELDITIDPTPAPPVVLDMDGDGVEFLGTSAGVAYDYGDGLANTAWVGADDAILVRDANGNGLVDNASEFVFGGNGMTDLEALHAQYGAQLDASDADFVMFAVWNDANSNGVVDANEMQSLAEAGIASIDLVSNGVAYSAANGEVEVAGTATFTRTDGSTGDVADAIFATGMMETQRVAANSNNVVLAAAVAAAGLAVSAPAAASVDGAEVATGRTTNAAVAVEAIDMSILGLATDTAMPALMGEMRDSFGTVEMPFQSALSRDFGPSIGELGSGHFDSMAPTALLQGSDMIPGQVAMPMLASNVAMPSAEALIAMAGLGNVQSTVTVETIVADALQGGGGPDINALLNALPVEGIAGNAGTDSLASLGSGFVPTWDTGQGAGFTFAGANVMSSEALVLHHDAIQPVANG